MYGPHPAVSFYFFFFNAKLHCVFKGGKKMLKCLSTLSMLVFVLKKTS